MENQLDLDPVLITGVSTGIGFEIAKYLLERNIKVVGTVRKDSDALELDRFGPGQFVKLVIDVNDHASVKKIPEILISNFKINRISALINNAGIALAAPIVDQDMDEIENIIKTNLISLIAVTKSLIPLLERSSDQPFSKIINVSSISGRSAAPFLSVYAASKHGVEGFSEGIRKELYKLGIQVIVVGPGSIKTPIWQKGFIVIKDKYLKSKFANSFELFLKIAMNEQQHALEVDDIAVLLHKILIQPNPCFRYAPIPRKWLNWYLPMLFPQKFYDHLTRKALKLDR